MTRRPYLTLVIILLLVAFALWVDLSKQITIVNPFNSQTLVNRNVDIKSRARLAWWSSGSPGSRPANQRICQYRLT